METDVALYGFNFIKRTSYFIWNVTYIKNLQFV